MLSSVVRSRASNYVLASHKAARVNKILTVSKAVNPNLHVRTLLSNKPSKVTSTQLSNRLLSSWNARRFYSETIKDADVVEEKPNATAQPVEEAAPQDTEKATGNFEKHEFQAETRKLLDIVARSLYTDKELISNASDALEKVRHSQLSGEKIEDSEAPLKISINVDPVKKTLTIQDTGIGMTSEEMIRNLGSIGHSGTLEYMKEMKNKDAKDIIGQFGVGFYSAFMVGNKVTVYSKSATPGSKGYCWTSDGTGSYEIAEAEGVHRGTKIIIHLNSKSEEFATKETIDKIVKKYSNFVGFDIELNGTKINTIKALWTLSKNQISAEDHKQFYQFIAHAYDEPLYHLHYSTDSPISIRALFYIGQQHTEKYGMGRMENGVNLFSRKVLIQAKATGLLPDFLRFIRGVVDSEDIPLNLSREHLQDSALIKRIGDVLTRRVLKWLEEEARRDPKQYEKFWSEFGNFLKEGLVTEPQFKDDVAKLLRCESSKTKPGELTSLDEYLSRMPPEQNEIFFLCVPNRALAESSPYFESFKERNQEVLFLYTQMDDFVMTNLSEYSRKRLITIESTQAKPSAQEEIKDATRKLNSEELKELVKWMKETLIGKVSAITESNRLRESPAIIVDHESSSFRRMMKYVDPARSPTIPKQQLEINPSHPIILALFDKRNSEPEISKMIVEQVFDNALVAAGLMDDARSMIPRLNSLLVRAAGVEGQKSTSTESSQKPQGQIPVPPKNVTEKEEKKEEKKEKKEDKETKKEKKEKKTQKSEEKE